MNIRTEIMKQKIYLVWVKIGEYKTIDAVFTEQEKAWKFIEHWKKELKNRYFWLQEVTLNEYAEKY